jgi:nucleoside-diphosphate-sugar epimerase
MRRVFITGSTDGLGRAAARALLDEDHEIVLDSRSCERDPGWVATKMGGPGAPDDFEMGYRTQTWLAVSDDQKSIGQHHRSKYMARVIPRLY